MTVPARLVKSAQLPGASVLVERPDTVQRWPGRTVLTVPGSRGLAVYSVAGLFDAGEPTVTFPMLLRERTAWWTVSPDGGLAVFSGRTGVWAVDPAGRIRWRFDHVDWPGARGSVQFTADGRHVWATTPGPPDEPAWSPDTGPGDRWLVFEAEEGKVVADGVLTCTASGSHHVAHPDGRHMALSVAEDEDRSRVYWGRVDGSAVRIRELTVRNRVIVDVEPTGAGYLTIAHDQRNAAWHAFPSGAVVGRHAAPKPHRRSYWDEPGGYFDHPGGYVDAETAIVSAVEFAARPSGARHWLVDLGTGRLRGEVGYPTAVASFVRPLGDGTWLTATDDVVCRWTVAA